MKFVRTASIAITLLACGSLYAQEKAFLVLCDSAPSQWVVLDGQGDWMSDVKSYTTTSELGGKTEIATIAYTGVIRPTNPRTMTYELAQIKSVSQQQFAGIIDGLQTDAAFVKNSGAFGNSPPRVNVINPSERIDDPLELDDQ